MSDEAAAEIISNKPYAVRQYRPSYFEGFQNEIYRNVPFSDLTKQPFCKNFEWGDFDRFAVEPYGDELIIMAYYKDGQHWVVAFAAEEGSAAAQSGRYARQDAGSA